MSMGENIRKRRLELHMSQQELADALGLKTRSSISKIENETNNLSQDKLMTLANILNTTIEYLLTGEPSSSDPSYKTRIIADTRMLSKDHKLKSKCAAVILAGGRYRINKHNIPYQFVSVKDKPIIIYTMEAYQRHPLVDEIYAVCADGWEDFLPAYAEKYSINKLKGIIPAGEKGILSVKNAVEWLASAYKASDIIILQESTRPLIDSETISNAIRCCKKFGSAITYTHLEDTTPFLINKDKKNVTPIDAYSLVTLQSPEVYTLGALKYAFIEAAKINHPLTETICSVFMHNIGRELSFCEGNHNNLRIIYEEDLRLFEALI
jgi:2-C-methyl-D-erythritol 4-phosphate cytidylyltransferase